MHDKSYSRGLFLCIPIRERELSVTVELSKPQLRMVDLNLLTVFDAGNDSNLLIVFYVQIMPDDFVMQLHRF